LANLSEGISARNKRLFGNRSPWAPRQKALSSKKRRLEVEKEGVNNVNDAIKRSKEGRDSRPGLSINRWEGQKGVGKRKEGLLTRPYDLLGRGKREKPKGVIVCKACQERS